MKTSSICFVVPGIPKPQERPRKGKHGNFYSPSSPKQAAIGLIALAARSQARSAILKGAIILSVEFFGLPKTTDLSNALKLIEDAMNKVVYEDDRQIAELHIYRRETSAGSERTEVVVQQQGECS